MSPGDHVALTIGGRLYRGTVLYVRDGTVRVEVPGRKPVTRPIARVKRVETATTWASRTADDPAALIAAGVCEVTRVDHEKRTVTVDPVPHLRPVPKSPKPLRDAAYLRHVRTLDCCVGRDGASGPCSGPVVAHHHGPRGMGEKTDDYRSVPLCDGHHREFHDTGTIGAWDRESLDRCFAYVMSNTLSFWMWASDRHAARERIVDALIAHIRESAA